MTPTEQIDDYLAGLDGWQRARLEAFRTAVHAAAPDVEEAWKWDVPVFLVEGRLVCAMSTFRHHVKYNFFAGAELPDPTGIFNSGLESKRSRSVNLGEVDTLDAAALTQLLGAAVAQARSATPKGR